MIQAAVVGFALCRDPQGEFEDCQYRERSIWIAERTALRKPWVQPHFLGQKAPLQCHRWGGIQRKFSPAPPLDVHARSFVSSEARIRSKTRGRRRMNVHRWPKIRRTEFGKTGTKLNPAIRKLKDRITGNHLILLVRWKPVYYCENGPSEDGWLIIRLYSCSDER